MITKLTDAIRRRGSENGQIAVMTVALLPILLVLIAINIDTGRQHWGNENAYNVAASAARAGTSALDGAAVANGTTTMNHTAAIQTAEAYIAASGFTGTATINGDEITVTVSSWVDTRVLNIFFIDALPVSGTATATLLTQ